jgi:hypothetical protein
MFHKNDDKAQKLLAVMYQEIESTLGEQIRQERLAIIDTTKKETGKVKTIVETRRQLSDEQVE